MLIGHSWGAMYATWFINEYGDYGGRLQGAVLSEPGAFTKHQLEEFVADAEGSIDFLGEPLNDATWSRQFMSPVDHARADYLFALTASVTRSEHNDPNDPAPYWRRGAVVHDRLLELANDPGFDWTTHLANFHHEVLFLRGDRNTAASLAHQRKLSASYPEARIVTIKDVGHEMIWERPREYLSRVRDYFEQIGFAGVAP